MYTAAPTASGTAKYINGEMFQKYGDADIRIIGRVESVDGKNATLTTSDSRSLIVNSNEQFIHPQNSVVLVLGRPLAGNQQTLKIQADLMIRLGDNFDMDAFDQVVKMMNGKFADLFTRK